MIFSFLKFLNKYILETTIATVLEKKYGCIVIEFDARQTQLVY
jgi:hypothetical protein